VSANKKITQVSFEHNYIYIFQKLKLNKTERKQNDKRAMMLRVMAELS